MEIIGYFMAFVIGILLGTIGGGGSILALPVLVYLFGVDTVTATSYSLFIVAITSFIGAINSGRQKNIDYKSAIIFAIPSMIAVYLVRRHLIPSIPAVLFEHTAAELNISQLLFAVFVLLIIAAGILMVKGKCTNCDNEDPDKKTVYNYPLIFTEGIVIGSLTGLVGAGGGFLVIPALVMYGNLPMRIAVGTSLLIIVLKSAAGIAGDIAIFHKINWTLLLSIISLSVAGILVGSKISYLFKEKTLKLFFGWFVIFLGLVIIIKEFIWIW